MSYSENIINHTKITLTLKKTGETKVILQTKENEKEPHITGAIAAGIPVTECADDSLDTLTFTVMNSETKALFRPLDVVTFTVDDGIAPVKYEMCVLSDHAETQSQINNTYKHTVTCIESTKILEKVKIFNLNLTNPNDALFTQFEKALTNAEPLVTTYDKNGNEISRRARRFEPTKELKTLLMPRAGEDFRFNNTDLRSVLDGILATCNARAEVKEIIFEGKNIKTIKIGYRSLTEVQKITPEWTFEKHGKILKEELENYAQDAAGKIVARGYNTVMSKPITFTDTFKAENYNVDNNTASIFLPFPVSDKGIMKFAIMGKVKPRCYYNNNFWEAKIGVTAPVDISKNLIPEEQYKLLSKSDQEQYISYKIGSTVVSASGTKQEIIFISDKIEDIINNSVKSIFGSEDSITEEGFKLLMRELRIDLRIDIDETKIKNVAFNAGSMKTLWFNRPYIISYYPLVDTATEVTKAGVYDKDEILLGIVDSQTENTLDQYRHGRQLEGLINRTGNDEYYIDVVAKSFNSLLPLRAQIESGLEENENYVVYKKECGIYDKFVKCRYYLSKNFNAIQKVAGVNREKHLFDIPLDSDECPIIIKKYLIFGSELVKGESGNERFINTALQTLFGKNVAMTSTLINDKYFKGNLFDVPGKINYMLLKTYIGEEEFPRDMLKDEITQERKNNSSFMLPCVGYGQAKQMNFVACPLDNYSMGYSRNGYVFSAFGDGGHMITHTPYVSRGVKTAGECDRFKLSLMHDHSVFASPHFNETNYGEILRDLPVACNKMYLQDVGWEFNDVLLNATDNTYEISINKDRTQKPMFCISLECVTAEQNYDDIFVGNAFCRENNLISENGGDFVKLKLVVSYSKALDRSVECLSDNYADCKCEVKDYFNADGGLLYKNNFSQNGSVKSWAIVNDKGEIYLAANGKLCNIYAGITDFPA